MLKFREMLSPGLIHVCGLCVILNFRIISFTSIQESACNRTTLFVKFQHFDKKSMKSLPDEKIIKPVSDHLIGPNHNIF